MNSIGGISWQRLEEQSSVTYPCRTEDDPGQPVVFTDTFPTKDGRGKFVPADLIRQRAPRRGIIVRAHHRAPVEHCTRPMTRRAQSSTRSSRRPWPRCSPRSRRDGASAGDVVTAVSRRGEIALMARADDGKPRGAIFIPFAFYEAAANLLTNAALDPVGKIAELKY